MDPHFNADIYLSQTGSNFNGQPAAASSTNGRSASTNPGNLGQQGARPLDKSIPVGGYTANAYKALDPHMRRYGEVDTLVNARKDTTFKSYDDFTKRFDQTHHNTKLRHPYL